MSFCPPFFGGLFGIVLGYVAAYGLSFFLTTVITETLLLISFFGAVIVGLIAGVYPALIAAKMDPVDALRTE